LIFLDKGHNGSDYYQLIDFSFRTMKRLKTGLFL